MIGRRDPGVKAAINSSSDQLSDDQGADVHAGDLAGLVEITDLAHRCSHSMSCPAVFLKNETAYVVVGATRDAASEGIDGRVAPYESSVEIPAEILEAALRDIILRKFSSST